MIFKIKTFLNTWDLFNIKKPASNMLHHVVGINNQSKRFSSSFSINIYCIPLKKLPNSGFAFYSRFFCKKDYQNHLWDIITTLLLSKSTLRMNLEGLKRTTLSRWELLNILWTLQKGFVVQRIPSVG